jgi:serine/threonine protein kinase
VDRIAGGMVSEDVPQAPGGFAAGARIAGYLLEEQIGQGGMAVVFRALDERLGRRVALKILAPALAADEAFRQRFIRESRAAAAVDDPHIIPVLDAGEAGGALFIAMRYARGGDVRSLVDQLGPLPAGRAAEIISQVASALDAAHGSGLVHRDVKPANMLLDADGGRDRPDHVYLSDFGLSKASLAIAGLTKTGQFLGTLDYVAPEQIEGKPVDGRADEYALACAAFELLSGAPPFRRPEAMMVMYAHLHEPLPRLTGRRPDLPPAADQVFARALAKAPGDRYESCQEFADTMRRALGLAGHHPGLRSIPVPAAGHPPTESVRQVPAGVPALPLRPGPAEPRDTSQPADPISGRAPAPSAGWRTAMAAERPRPVSALVFGSVLLSVPLFAIALHFLVISLAVPWLRVIGLVAALGIAVSAAGCRRSRIWALALECNLVWCLLWVLYQLRIIHIAHVHWYIVPAVLFGAAAIINISLCIAALIRVRSKNRRDVHPLLPVFLGCMAVGLGIESAVHFPVKRALHASGASLYRTGAVIILAALLVNIIAVTRARSSDLRRTRRSQPQARRP